MFEPLKRLLDYLNEVVDSRHREEVTRRFQGALDFQSVDRLPLVISAPLADVAPFSPLAVCETFTDPERMLYNELVHAFDTSIVLNERLQDDLPFTVRANFGTVLIASMFGAPVEQLENNPPWIRHEAGAEISLDQVLDRDPLDFSQGWCPRALQTMEAYRAILASWPELRSSIGIVLPDLQGPMDNLELVRGSGLFLELATEPDKVDAALKAVATAQIGFARRLHDIVQDGPPGYAHQHAVMIKGNILIRADSAIMVSPEMYRQRLAPHDERVLSELGGGGIHCCGCIRHLVEAFLELPSLRSLDLGQSELNDVDAIYQQARAREIPLIRVAVDEEDLFSGQVKQRFPSGVVLIHRARSFEHATRVMKQYAELE